MALKRPINSDDSRTFGYLARPDPIPSYSVSIPSSIPVLFRQEKIEDIRNILIADRMLVQVVKQMKPLHKNVATYMASPNKYIRSEYNVLRRRILKITRTVNRISHSDDLGLYLEKLHGQRLKAKRLDVMVTGRVDKLVLQGKINEKMAGSLMNDSIESSRIARKLVDVAILLYTPKDFTIHAIDEQESNGDADVQDIKMTNHEEPFETNEIGNGQS